MSWLFFISVKQYSGVIEPPSVFRLEKEGLSACFCPISMLSPPVKHTFRVRVTVNLIEKYYNNNDSVEVIQPVSKLSGNWFSFKRWSATVMPLPITYNKYCTVTRGKIYKYAEKITTWKSQWKCTFISIQNMHWKYKIVPLKNICYMGLFIHYYFFYYYFLTLRKQQTYYTIGHSIQIENQIIIFFQSD